MVGWKDMRSCRKFKTNAEREQKGSCMPNAHRIVFHSSDNVGSPFIVDPDVLNHTDMPRRVHVEFTSNSRRVSAYTLHDRIFIYLPMIWRIHPSGCDNECHLMKSVSPFSAAMPCGTPSAIQGCRLHISRLSNLKAYQQTHPHSIQILERRSIQSPPRAAKVDSLYFSHCHTNTVSRGLLVCLPALCTWAFTNLYPIVSTRYTSRKHDRLYPAQSLAPSVLERLHLRLVNLPIRSFYIPKPSLAIHVQPTGGLVNSCSAAKEYSFRSAHPPGKY
ncbi:uncharacterized protein BDR25DRAFT_66094 [Lindgomyces ingoldianus]|uniref:Uncharacterized protein n=1 Tax=Lindgomyces ingoldianus TaxID=673940 RepID=A0ACB6RAU8_9PLEO|nr:uncharacterized protein BDR25DRAFT_66094 [Lindgomyces ingoldianus]KAF2476448.1 hypothetical protein BDR25DRAFT_66094 [Lindgomyces ingoldianus]